MQNLVCPVLIMTIFFFGRILYNNVFNLIRGRLQMWSDDDLFNIGTGFLHQPNMFTFILIQFILINSVNESR